MLSHVAFLPLLSQIKDELTTSGHVPRNTTRKSHEFLKSQHSLSATTADLTACVGERGVRGGGVWVICYAVSAIELR